MGKTATSRTSSKAENAVQGRARQANATATQHWTGLIKRVTPKGSTFIKVSKTEDLCEAELGTECRG
jgi:hypothetical protein